MIWAVLALAGLFLWCPLVVTFSTAVLPPVAGDLYIEILAPQRLSLCLGIDVELPFGQELWGQTWWLAAAEFGMSCGVGVEGCMRVYVVILVEVVLTCFVIVIRLPNLSGLCLYL